VASALREATVRRRGRLHRGRRQQRGIGIEGGDGMASREVVTARRRR
jgi:hypothetical protein